MKLLIVEDDKYFANSISEFFSDYGIETAIVESVQECLAENIESYDAIIIDVMLPNDPSISGLTFEETRAGYYSGVALARKLKKMKPESKMIILSAGISGREVMEWAHQQKIPFVLKYDKPHTVLDALAKVGLPVELRPPRAFIVHGRDEHSLSELKNYLQNTLEWQEPIVLRERPNCGRTIIEKFEDYASKIDIVFVLMTPDDSVIGDSDDEKRRARQNVIFELGFFYGVIGRRSGRVIVLYKGPIELPSDIHGIAWINIEHGIEAAGEKIRKEIDQLLE